MLKIDTWVIFTRPKKHFVATNGKTKKKRLSSSSWTGNPCIQGAYSKYGPCPRPHRQLPGWNRWMGAPDPNVGPPENGNSRYSKPYITWVFMDKLSPRIPRKHNKYHGYTVRGTPFPVPLKKGRFFISLPSAVSGCFSMFVFLTNKKQTPKPLVHLLLVAWDRRFTTWSCTVGFFHK